MYDRIISKALHTPWAITPRYLSIIQEILRFRASGGRLTPEEIQARIGAAAEPDARPKPRRDGAVAVIPIYGVIAHRAFEASSGATSTELIGELLKRAVGDPDVGTILFDISSPGGTVEGVPELGRQIFEARQVKRTIALANAQAASAAYWLASQAEELVITPSGSAGSIGVFLLHEDMSEALAKEGIKIDAIKAGDNKLEGAPWEPLSDETRAFLQGEVDKVYADFLAAVAKGRGVSVSEVKKTMGQGRVFGAKESVTRGMADRIATFDELLGKLQGSAPRRRSMTAGPVALDAGEVVLSAETAMLEEIAATGRQIEEAREQLAATAQAQADADAADATLAMLEHQ
jgi:capsid assembly protease